MIVQTIHASFKEMSQNLIEQIGKRLRLIHRMADFPNLNQTD